MKLSALYYSGSPMIDQTIRFAKRFAVLLPGVIIAYLSVRDVFPFFHRRIGWGLAILVTYALGAYVFVPALIRLIRIISPADHLPLYCVTPDGFASDPINIGIIGTRRELITAMEKAGWVRSDPYRGKYVVRYFVDSLLGREYPTAPVSNLFLFGRKQDLAFEIQLGSISQRHHVRFWATTYREDEQLSVRSIHWHHRSQHVRGDNLLWVGAALLDIGHAPVRHTMQITHMIHPDTNQERELIVDQFRDAKLIKNVTTVKLGKPYRLMNRAWGGYLHTDGKMTVVHLRPKPKPKPAAAKG